MITIQQLPKQSNTLGYKREIPSRQTRSTWYTISLFSDVKIFLFYPQVRVGRDILKKQLSR